MEERKSQTDQSIHGKITRRKVLGAAAGGVAGGVLATLPGGMRSVGATAGRTMRQAQASQLAWKGTITMFAQAYTPNSKRENVVQLKAFQDAADAYQQQHPDIKIEFVDEDFPEYPQTVRVKASGGELWDVYWAQWGELNGTFPRGIAVDLTPYFQQPNPYIEGNQAWQDAMNPTVVAETVAPDGAHYNINGDYVGTAFFYNKELFAQAGITAAPTSWPEILDASEKLKAAGIPSTSGIPDYSWFQRHFLTDFYFNDYPSIAGCDETPAISALDEAAAIKQRILSTDDPRFMAWWPIFKQATDYWMQEYLNQALETSSMKMLQDFVAGKAAMFYSGSWTPNDLKVRNTPFEWGAFSFPVLTPDVTDYTTGADTSGSVGGPNAAYQYAMSTPQANKSMKDEAKAEAVLDWLRFIGTPGVIERVCNELGAFAPTWPGTTPGPGLETFAQQANTELKAVWVGNSSPKLGPNLQRIFGQYLAGDIDLDQATDQVQRELDTAAEDYARENNADLDTCA